MIVGIILQQSGVSIIMEEYNMEYSILCLWNLYDFILSIIVSHDTYSNLSYFGEEKTPPASNMTGQKSTYERGNPAAWKCEEF